MFIKTNAVLFTAGLSWASALNVGHGGIRHVQQEEDVKTFDADDKLGWKFPNTPGLSCDIFCDNFDGGVCNIIPMHMVNSEKKLKYIRGGLFGITYNTYNTLSGR
jgi:hypothetical protein